MARKQDLILEIQNVEIYNYYRERLLAAALAQFEWNNLPETCDRRYFEKRLLFDGTGAMFIPTGADFWLSGGYVFDGAFDFYGYPTNIKGMGYNAENIETDNFVVCYDNVSRTPLLPKIDLYARLLYECHQVFRSNLAQQTTPYIVTGPKNIALSITNMFRRLFSFDRVIELKASLDPNAITTLDLKVPYIGNDLLDSLKVIWAEAMSMLGITSQTTKKERMLDQELTMNRMADMVALNTRLQPRIDFCNRINDRYNLDLSVNLCTEAPHLQPYKDAAVQQLDANDGDSSTPYSAKDPRKEGWA